jgi:DNA-binding response OmpR family regulator
MAKSFKLLIIDDSTEILAGLSNYLSIKKYAVATAKDGLEALKLFESEEYGFDLVITDIVMPNISGVGVISILKKKYPQIPVIAITGMGEHPEALAIEARADVVLEKPFDLSDLEKNITELLAKRN